MFPFPKRRVISVTSIYFSLLGKVCSSFHSKSLLLIQKVYVFKSNLSYKVGLYVQLRKSLADTKKLKTFNFADEKIQVAIVFLQSIDTKIPGAKLIQFLQRFCSNLFDFCDFPKFVMQYLENRSS